MRVNLLARLKKLDASFAPNQPPPAFRYGWLTTLPGRVPVEGFGLSVRVIQDAVPGNHRISDGSFGWSGAYGRTSGSIRKRNSSRS